MNRWFLPALFFGLGTLFSSAFADERLATPETELFDEYGEALLQGPIHEAYAEQYSQQPMATPAVEREPPPPVTELPPEQKLEGSNVEWLPGYWFWDDQRDDFIWISGVWRKMPPGQRWLPGYWDEADGQFHWVPGTWVATTQAEVEYLAESPPDTLELGPVGEAPSAEHFWVPGCWVWQQNNYAWRPGYWSMGYSNWVWVPDRYLWTPAGYMFAGGYWDYPFATRGTLFAPFWFNQPVFAQPGFFFTPRVSLMAAALQAHLWVRPGWRHYYFGDFYGMNHGQFGMYPWHMFHRGFGRPGPWGFDPLFAFHNRNFGARGINFFQQVNNQHNVFVNQVDRRPPRTYRDQLSRERSWRNDPTWTDRGSRSGRGWDRAADGPSWNERRLGESFRDVAASERNRYRDVSDDVRQSWRTDRADTANLASWRRDAETRNRSGRGGEGRSGERGGEVRGRGAVGADASRSGVRTAAALEASGRGGVRERLQLPPDQRRSGASGRAATGATRSPALSGVQGTGAGRTQTDVGQSLRDRMGAAGSAAAAGSESRRPSDAASRVTRGRPTLDSPPAARTLPDRAIGSGDRSGLGGRSARPDAAGRGTPTDRGGRPEGTVGRPDTGRGLMPDSGRVASPGTGGLSGRAQTGQRPAEAVRPSASAGAAGSVRTPGGSALGRGASVAPGSSAAAGGTVSGRPGLSSPSRTSPSVSPGANIGGGSAAAGGNRSAPGLGSGRPTLPSAGGSRPLSSPNVSRPALQAPSRATPGQATRSGVPSASGRSVSPGITPGRQGLSAPRTSSGRPSSPAIAPRSSAPSMSMPRSSAPSVSRGGIGRSMPSAPSIGRSAGGGRSMPSISSGGAGRSMPSISRGGGGGRSMPSISRGGGGRSAPSMSRGGRGGGGRGRGR